MDLDTMGQFVFNALVVSALGGFLTGFVYFGTVRFPMKGFWNLLVAAWAFIVTFFFATFITIPATVLQADDWIAGGIIYSIFIALAAIGTIVRKRLRD